MKKILLFLVTVLAVLFFARNLPVFQKTNTCPGTEEFWQKYVELNDSPKELSEYISQISTQCVKYFKSTSKPDCDSLYSYANIYFLRKISEKDITEVIKSLNGKCSEQSHDISNMVNNNTCLYSLREHKCY